MATWDDVRRLAMALPEVEERRSGRDDLLQWSVKDKLFVWERPLRKADLEALGDAAPDGEILGVRVANLHVKEAILGGSGVEEPGARDRLGRPLLVVSAHERPLRSPRRHMRRPRIRQPGLMT